MIQVNQTSSMLRRIEQVLVKAADKDQNFIESCRLQFRFRGNFLILHLFNVSLRNVL